MQTDNIINLSALQKSEIVESPFPYTIISNFVNLTSLTNLVRDFPDLDRRGSFPASSVKCSTLFQQFIEELEGKALRELIAEKFKMSLQNTPTMLTLRGYTTERDGNIHADSKDKLITLLLYMNQTWEDEGGKLRLLKNEHSLDDYIEEISPLAGSCVIFKVTENGWHGHKPFIGKRLSLQLNYLTGEGALTKHLNQHRFSALLKNWFPPLFKHKNY